MKATRELESEDCSKLANLIRDNYYTPINNLKTTIFLCGADINAKDKMRYQIAKEFSDQKDSYQFEIIYPEDIFDELLYSSQSRDLLSLENLLANNVDVVLIVPESPGSFAELGAFANNASLRKKIVCVMDQRFKKHKSFINKGPIKLIRNEHKSGVVFVEEHNLVEGMEKIKKAVRRVRNSNKDRKTLNVNLLQLDSFLLPAIYLLEPVNNKILSNIVGSAISDVTYSYEASKTALAILTKKKAIEYTTEGYKLTNLGLTRFEELRKTKTRYKIQDKISSMDELRLKILNYKLRNKKMRL